jgi:hypothetical protein
MTEAKLILRRCAQNDMVQNQILRVAQDDKVQKQILRDAQDDRSKTRFFLPLVVRMTEAKQILRRCAPQDDNLERDSSLCSE